MREGCVGWFEVQVVGDEGEDHVGMGWRGDRDVDVALRISDV